MSDRNIGGQPGSAFPFIHAPGPHGYIIQLAGAAERDVIVAEHVDMLARLCAFNNRFCLEP